MVLTCNLKFPNFLWGFMSPASRGGSSHLKKRERCVTAHADGRKEDAFSRSGKYFTMSGKPFSAHEYFVADELWDTVGWVVEYAVKQLQLLGDPLSMWG